MCKFNPKNDGRRIDPCIRKLIETLKGISEKGYWTFEVLASCCGHGKYPMTIVIERHDIIYDMCSWIDIPRKKRFYVKDKQGYYFIPEVKDRWDNSKKGLGIRKTRFI